MKQNTSCVFELWGTWVLCIPDHVHMTFLKKFASVFSWNPLKEIIPIKSALIILWITTALPLEAPGSYPIP